MNSAAHDGRSTLERPGFSYLPRFIDKDEGDALVEYFGSLVPLWEERHRDSKQKRSAGRGGHLTRPVYWLGAWQFACLGYYAEPHHRQERCLRAEPFPAVMQGILERLRPVLSAHEQGEPSLPNTCLINYYGRQIGDGPPRDYARLRKHRDGEPGPVVMFSVGQPGLLEFVDCERDDAVELAVWTRHRSVTILSGAEFKDRLYHRITKVRYGQSPQIGCRLDAFETRRVSVSFRHVPETLISDFGALGDTTRSKVRDYVEQLAEESPHFEAQLATETQPSG